MLVTFIRKTIEMNAEVKTVMEFFKSSFENFRQKFPNEISDQLPNATDVREEDTKGVGASILRGVNSGTPGIFREFVDEITNSKKGRDYVLTEESFELSPDAHEYYTEFASDLRKKFILSSGIDGCTKYDDGESKFPDGPSGLLLLIELLLGRIVARILSNRSRSHGKELINLVLSDFMRKISSADRRTQIACGLKADGTCWYWFKKDDSIKKPGMFLANSTQVDASAESETIYDEIESLTAFVDSFEKTQCFKSAINSGLEACKAEETSLRQRVVVGLYYLLNPEEKVFPTYLLNEKALSAVINDQVSQARTKFKLTQSSELIPLNQNNKGCEIINVGICINDLLLLVKKNPNAFNQKAEELLKMIQENVEFENHRMDLKELFYNLDGCREAMGFMFILSGTLEAENVQLTITNYRSKGGEIQKGIPPYLKENGNISMGERRGIWSVVDSRWNDASKAITMISDPRVQRRIAREGINKLQMLNLINKKLHNSGCLPPGKNIINQECLKRLINGLMIATSANPHMANLGAPDVDINSTLNNREAVAPIPDRSLTPPRAAAITASTVTTPTQDPLIKKINHLLVEYAIKYGYLFKLENIDLDKRVQLQPNEPSNFKFDANRENAEYHERRASWMLNFLTFLNAKKEEFNTSDIQTLLDQRLKYQDICEQDDADKFSASLSEIDKIKTELFSKLSPPEIVQPVPQRADVNDNYTNTTGEKKMPSQLNTVSAPAANSGHTVMKTPIVPEKQKSSLLPSADAKTENVPMLSDVTTVLNTSLSASSGQGEVTTSTPRLSSYVDKESYRFVYNIQTILSERAPVFSDGVTRENYEHYRPTCAEVRYINPQNFVSVDFNKKLYEAVLIPYQYQATESPAFWTNAYHAGWGREDLLALRYHYSKFVEAFQCLHEFNCVENNKVVKTSDEVKHMQNKMISSLLAAFLRKMAVALPFHTQAQSLLVEVCTDSDTYPFRPAENILIDEGDNGVVGKYRVDAAVDADFMRDRIRFLEARVMTADGERDAIAQERDTLQTDLSASRSEAVEERKQKKALQETLATYGIQIAKLTQQMQELHQQKQNIASLPATVSSQGLFASGAASSNDAQLQHKSKTNVLA